MVNRKLIYQIISQECKLSYGYVLDNQDKIALTPQECFDVVSKAFEYAGVGRLEPKALDNRDLILEAVCDFYKVYKEVLISNSQRGNVCKARYFAAWIMKENGVTRTEISRRLNKSYAYLSYAKIYVDNLDIIRKAEFDRLTKFVSSRLEKAKL